MRDLSAVALVSILVFATTLPCLAQPRLTTTPAVRQNPAPSVRFRSRTTAERLVTANRLRANVTPAQMLAPFTVTPRIPFVASRGSLSSLAAVSATQVDPTGELGIHPPEAVAILELRGAAGLRFLVDCTVNVTTSISSQSARVVIDYQTVGAGP